MNLGEKEVDKRISIGKEWIQNENANKITRFLGIWLNCKLKDSLVRSRAQEVV